MKQQIMNKFCLPASPIQPCTLLEILKKGGGERGWEQGFHESIFVEHVVLVFQNLTLLQSILCSIIDAMLVTFRKV